MKLRGTLSEWISYKPSAILWHPELQESVEVSSFTFHEDGLECTYMSAWADGPPMTPYFGSQCPYVTKGKVNYTACVTHMWYGGGAIQAIANSLAEDDRWVEIECL